MKKEKMMVFSLREFDEREFFDKYAEESGFEIVSTSKMPTLENAHLAEGCRYINVITTPIDRFLLDKFHSFGVEYIVTRTIGYDHIDINYANRLGIKIANTPYDPNGVAEYTLMLMLMCIRKMKSISKRFDVQDYTLKGLIGDELSSMTVGIIGMGRIGKRLANILSGFGCRIIAYSPHPDSETPKFTEYVPLQQLYREADIITLHAPANENNRHMLDKSAISIMKNGVVIINTARGSLIDSNALIDALKCGKIGAAGLDVIEDESQLFYYDKRGEIIDNDSFYQLSSYPNVIITHHMAFYSKQAVETMVRDSIRGAVLDISQQSNPWLVSE